MCICKENIAVHQQLCFKKIGPEMTVGIQAIPRAKLGMLFEDRRRPEGPIKKWFWQSLRVLPREAKHPLESV